MHTHIHSVFILCFIFTLVSCTYDFQETENFGEEFSVPVDFTPLYVIGDYHASGFMDGALYKGGQDFSYPSLLNKKLMEVLEEDQNLFQQPVIESGVGFNIEVTKSDGVGRSKYFLEYPKSWSIYPRRSTRVGKTIEDWNGAIETLTDFSLPLLKIYQTDSVQVLQKNRYFARLSVYKSLLDMVIEASPEVILIDIGNEDILQYSLNGAAGDAFPDLDSIGDKDLIAASDFDFHIRYIITQLLSATNAQIFIANISNPLLAPYFHTLSRNFETEIYSAKYLDSISQYYQGFNQDVFQYNRILNPNLPHEDRRPIIDIDSQGYPNISPPFNSRVIEDEYLKEAVIDGRSIPKWRQTVENELVLFKNERDLNPSTTLSGEIPLSDEEVLTIPEIKIINNRLFSFNQSIENIAAENARVSLFNVNRIIKEISEGEYSYQGVNFSNKFDKYGISADGYSLNPRGNAIIANELINSINSTYGTYLKQLNPNNYRGNEFVFDE